ncbi:thiamine pyrophosphate-binding protein [Herbiconiux daphne]|uniref:Thiamine pyrophosphate-binding protein n=1 Tax=Herbiconiux daphne TaxID=2970914 RepID=A0ABT2H3K3_9MICO|nr:thiamine pyrophosphate-binding protein [Herbiconiux daphne]MCS5734514.1 thiamine pyrophosphate-binding protein [Herbiconiux daphne]
MIEVVSVAEAVGRTLAAMGAAHIFGVVGSGNFHVTNAMIREGVPFTATRHETGAACMADAHSRASGRVVITTVHQGCGLTNAMTGITEAAKSHSRVLVVTGDTADGDTNSNFFIDQDQAVAALGAVPTRIHSAASAVADAARAFSVCAGQRKTVVLSLPIDLQLETIEWDPSLVPVHHDPAPTAPAAEAVLGLLDEIAAAERPVFVGGRGAARAAGQIRRLADRAGALLITSAVGRGVFEDDPWALDIMGGFSTDGAAELVEGADLVVAFGASLNRWTTRSGSLLRGATVVQIDDRLDALGVHHPVALGIVGDCGLVAAAAADELERRGTSFEGYRTPVVAERVAASRYWSEQPYFTRAEADRVDPHELSNVLDEILPMNRIVVSDGGNFNCYPAAHLRVPDNIGYCLPLAFQSIGLSIASAIGAAVAVPGRLPIVGIGDGAFTMAPTELDTAVRLGLGLLVVIYDDNAYGAEVHMFEGDTDELAAVQFPDTDLAAMARGFGCEAITVRRLGDLAGLHEWLNGPRDRPLVLDAKVARFPSWMMAHSLERKLAASGAH